jgi:hypothetical protein
MQGTSGIRFENCGRRFSLKNWLGISTVSGRLQNWLDVDGSVAGFAGQPAIIGSGLADAGKWWKVDDAVVDDAQGPLKFIRKNDGPQRGLGHFHMEWDSALHSQVGVSTCGNGEGFPCPIVGYIRHVGSRFTGDAGLPVTANADIAGLVGGFGWYLRLVNGKAPKRVEISQVEVDPDTPMVLSIAYPPGSTFTVRAEAAWCSPDAQFSCTQAFSLVSSVTDVRRSLGNSYHVTANGVLTVRIIQPAQTFVGTPNWILPTWNTTDRGGTGTVALNRFERKNVRLPVAQVGPKLVIEANCIATGAYCDAAVSPTAAATVDSVCATGFSQRSYDRCCSDTTPLCVAANGAFV